MTTQEKRNTVPVHLRLPPEVARRLRELARSRGVTLARALELLFDAAQTVPCDVCGLVTAHALDCSYRHE